MNQIRIDTTTEYADLSKVLCSEAALPNYGTVKAIEQFEKIQECLRNSILSAFEPLIKTQEHITNIVDSLNSFRKPYEDMLAKIGESFINLSNTVAEISIPVLSIYNENLSEEDEEEVRNTDERIITEIFLPDSEKKINVEESPIITLSPVNDQVLQYLLENPEAFYQLSDTDFEIVMAEIYAKLGYNVTRTQTTRDGGKDIIIRKPEVIGDFIYYVECKKYAPNRHIGVGLVRNLIGTVNTDRVNGGILATTSFFTRDARQFILDNQWGCQIQMHDYNKIQDLLRKTMKGNV